MDKLNRPIRSKRHSRKSWSSSNDLHKPLKRLFTPEIKCMLKDWLVRRRDNPYPSRDEKKQLAHQCGLTYTQICNWFANWRRKLKNSDRATQRKTWGYLIKNYNTNAKGNVEQFSINSNDSIWHDDGQHFNRPSSDSSEPRGTIHGERSVMQPAQINLVNTEILYHSHRDRIHTKTTDINANSFDHCYTSVKFLNSGNMPQCSLISSTTTIEDEKHNIDSSPTTTDSQSSLTAKYKQHIMEKYWKGLSTQSSTSTKLNKSSRPQLNKWLESTANFTPNKHNYIDWNVTNTKLDGKRRDTVHLPSKDEMIIHHKEELDAAEALTRLAGNYRNRLTSESFSGN